MGQWNSIPNAPIAPKTLDWNSIPTASAKPIDNSETTKLTSEEEPRFRDWALKNAPNDIDQPDSHYDLRGFWKKNPDFVRAPGQHLTDEFKQHGHPTFSVESRYSKGPNDGGTWNGDTYVPEQDHKVNIPESHNPFTTDAGGHTVLRKELRTQAPNMEIAKIPDWHLPYSDKDNLVSIADKALHFGQDTLNDPFAVAGGIYGAGKKLLGRGIESAIPHEVPKVDLPSKAIEHTDILNPDERIDRWGASESEPNGVYGEHIIKDNPLVPRKPKLKLNSDGTFTNEAGRVIDKSGKDITDIPKELRTSKGKVKITFSKIPGEKPNVNSGDLPNVTKGSHEIPHEVSLPSEHEFGEPPNIPPENQLPLGGGDDGFGKGAPPKNFSWGDWWANRSRKDKIFDVAADASKSMQTSFDLSWPLRQGRKIIHTKAWRQGVKEGVKAFKDEKSYTSAMKVMKDDPLFPIAEKSGVDFTDLGDKAIKREEQFRSPLAENVPGLGKFVRASGRAYTVMGNKARFEYWKAVVKDPAVDKNAAATLVNTLTGRAKLPGKTLEAASPALNYVLYSPKAIYSNIRVLNPYTYIKAPRGVRKEYVKSALQMIGTTYAVNNIAEVAGAKVTWDPHSSDFGKIVHNNTHIDIMGGVQQPLVLISRMLTGKKISAGGKKTNLWKPKYGEDNAFDVMAEFGRSKASPLLGAVINSVTGTDAVGNETNPLKEVGKMYTPLIAQDAYEVAQENPELAPIVTGLVGLGASQQTFKPKTGGSGKYSIKMPKVKF